MNSLKKQRGAAIIVALFVVALVAAAAIAMIERLRTDIRRTELILNATTADFYAQGSVIWAIDQLNRDWDNAKNNAVIDFAPIKSPLDHQNGATIFSVIYDAQGFFNLNNLANSQYQGNFVRLMRTIAPEINEGDANTITQSVMDWVSPNVKNPALDEYYRKLSPPYRSPHRPMGSISELRLVKGMTPQLFSKLMPYITVLPGNTTINVNSASAPILMSLSVTLTADAAKTLEATCKRAPFPTMEAFQAFDIVKNNPFETNKITIVSAYFLVKTIVTLGHEHIVLYTMLQRSLDSTKGGKSKTIILWQSKGTL